MATVTPWKVEGKIDYAQLMKQFGLQPFGKVSQKFNDLLLFRRKMIFAHRDFDRITAAIKARKPFAMMTGLMPSGKFHFGHKMVAEQMIFYQSLGAKVYVTVADVEAYNSRASDMVELRKIAVEEYLLNYLALGLDLKKVDFYFQSNRSNDAKKANAYYRLQNQLARHATFNEFKAVYGDITPGKMVSSLLQAADMLHSQLPEFEGNALPVVIPVGPDQDPHLRIARDMARRYKTYKFTQLSSTYHIFMPGLKGGKMSSSDPNSYIALTDDPEDAARKVKKYAFSGGQATVEEHRKKGGNPSVDVAYQMLRYGLEPDDKKLQKIHDEYKDGSLLTGELKQITIEKLKTFLINHQKERKKNRKKTEKYLD
jgi:tryptophanyl-tRNA synthetase